MNIKKYQFGDNLIYEVEDLDTDVYKSLSDMVNTETALLKVDESDFSLLCEGYDKLMIGFGKISELDNLLNLFDLYKDSDRLILSVRSKDINSREIFDTISKVKAYFEDIDIIYTIDQTTEIHDVVLYLPIKSNKKTYWVCPRCNNKNLIDVMKCTLCNRDQPY